MICYWLEGLYFENKDLLTSLGTLVDPWTKQQSIATFWSFKKFKPSANNQPLEGQQLTTSFKNSKVKMSYSNGQLLDFITVKCQVQAV